MNCANEEIKVWICENVRALGQIWKKAELTVVEAKDHQRRPRVLVFMTGQSDNEKGTFR